MGNKHRNVVLDKIARIYNLYLQRLTRFENNANILIIRDDFKKDFVGGICLERNAPYADKVHLFFKVATLERINISFYNSVKEVRRYHRKYRSCSHDQCGKKGPKEHFKICRGCLCVLYCSKRCQKLDWIDGHR